jgi:multicomponent Na+:H+ antiporter subunit E
MTVFLLNLLLAITWRAATGIPGLANIFLGFVLGYLVLSWLKPLLGQTTYFERLPKGIRFVIFFLQELVLANFRVAWDVVTPKAYRRPGIVAVPLDAKTDTEITLLSILITLTPGTLSLDVSDDRQVLYVHGMFVDDPDAFRREIKEGFEQRVLELLR